MSQEDSVKPPSELAYWTDGQWVDAATLIRMPSDVRQRAWENTRYGFRPRWPKYVPTPPPPNWPDSPRGTRPWKAAKKPPLSDGDIADRESSTTKESITLPPASDQGKLRRTSSLPSHLIRLFRNHYRRRDSTVPVSSCLEDKAKTQEGRNDGIRPPSKLKKAKSVEIRRARTEAQSGNGQKSHALSNIPEVVTVLGEEPNQGNEQKGKSLTLFPHEVLRMTSWG